MRLAWSMASQGGYGVEGHVRAACSTHDALRISRVFADIALPLDCLGLDSATATQVAISMTLFSCWKHFVALCVVILLWALNRGSFLRGDHGPYHVVNLSDNFIFLAMPACCIFMRATIGSDMRPVKLARALGHYVILAVELYAMCISSSFRFIFVVETVLLLMFSAACIQACMGMDVTNARAILLAGALLSLSLSPHLSKKEEAQLF